jgi:IS605 OrfB family transposase
MRFVPMYGGTEFKVEFVYSSEYQKQTEQISETASGYMSIDIGVNNLMACSLFSNGDVRQFLIDGKYIKAVNHYYNKTKARLQGEYDKNKSIKGMDTKRFRRLSKSRLNKIDDYFNRCVKIIVKLCLENGVKTVIVGYNEGQKQGVNIGHVNNQTFVSIPYQRLRQKLSYKCELSGIECVFQEESYTSKASCLDLDNVPDYDPERTDKPVFSGNRRHRGLYVSCNGTVINADINGSVNILRKYLLKRNGKDVPSNQLRALVNGPCQRLKAFAQAHSFREV